MVNVDSTAGNVVDDSQSMTSEDELHSNENVAGRFKFDDETAINNEEDLLVKLNLMDLRLEEYIIRFHFPDLNVAFMFYKWYGSMRGFSARKCRMMKNCRGEITQQTFVCHEEGHGREKHYNREGRIRKAKPNTRCRCEAKYQVHVDDMSGRWYIKYFNDVHNHTLVL